MELGLCACRLGDQSLQQPQGYTDGTLRIGLRQTLCGQSGVLGEYVMVLSRQPGLKQGPQWIPGIWVGKTEEDDLRMVVASSGLVRGKAVRRTGQPWRSVYSFMVKEKPYRNPNTRRPL